MKRRTVEQIKADIKRGSKVCNACGKRKEFCNFIKQSGGDGYVNECNDCKNAKRRKRATPNYKRTPEQLAYDIANGSKVCGKCGERKAFKHFPNATKGADGHDCTCYSCKPMRNKRYNTASRYNITEEEYQEIISRGCEVCGSRENLCIDHCHTTGKVRGCLCSNCNTALGLMYDNPDNIIKLSKYIKRTGKF